MELYKNYKHKIKTLIELKKIIGKFPRKKKIVMCHGVFDVVHPGHIRHLAFAKSKADLLIVSITADKHIKKGTYRPHIPENMRAISLAVFEMVDYVLIDNNQKPNINISKLKPDYFAKGFEYNSEKVNPDTQEEMKDIKKYGGKMIFTPGDIVYSSSKFLNYTEPNLDLDKLLLLMHNNSIKFEDLINSLTGLDKVSVHIIGDTIVDSYTWASLIGGQIKTPTLSVLFQKEEKYVGGAGIVAKHIAATGAKTTFTSVLGNDEIMKFVLKDLKKTKMKLNIIVDTERVTTNKNAIIADNYRLLKLDKLDNRPIPKEILDKLCSMIKYQKADSVIFSDFRHGIFSKNTNNKLISSIPKNVFKVADSQVASRWGNIADFKNFDLITPNEREARFTLADQDSSIGILSDKLKEQTNFKKLILKLGKRGILCSDSDKKNSSYTVGSFVNKALDPVGAGDALLAYTTVVYLKTKNFVVASIIGSIAAACECEINGNKTINIKDIIKKIKRIEEQAKLKYL